MSLVPPVSLFALAMTVRLLAVAASKGGFRGDFGYDPSVYYTAADALSFGRLPYRDFVLLHPPGLTLALTPFAALGRATTDMTGFVTANVCLSALGALNAALVYVLMRRLGLSNVAGWLAGAFYAVWYGAAYAELSVRLEPLGNLAFACGLLALTGRTAARPSKLLLGGAAFGFAVSVKLWWLAPVAVVMLWLATEARSVRRLAWSIGGMAGAVLLVNLPFFVVAPHAMTRMLIEDQLGRSSHTGAARRLASMSSIVQSLGLTSHRSDVIAAIAFVVVFGTVLLLAWRVRAARVFVALAVMQVGVLMLTASFFWFYLDWLAIPYAVVVGAAWESAARSRVPWWRVTRGFSVGVLVAAAALTAVGVFATRVQFIQPFPRAELTARMPPVRCVMTITPISLIQTDRLSPDLAHGCANWVDATGRTFNVDKSGSLPRRHNPKWQRDLRRYLLSGGAFIVVGGAGGPDAATLHALRHRRLLVRSGDVALYLTGAGKP